MKCEHCDRVASHHVTEVVAGLPADRHLCEDHVTDWTSPAHADRPPAPFRSSPDFFWREPELWRAVRDHAAHQKVAANLLPALCLALLDETPEVRVVAAYDLMLLGRHAQPAAGALRDRLTDGDGRVRKAAGIALDAIEAGQKSGFFPDSP